MTVEQLIEKLKESPPDLSVKVYDYYWGDRVDLHIVNYEVEINRNPNRKEVYGEVVFYTDRRLTH